MANKSQFILHYVSESRPPVEKPLPDGQYILGRDPKCNVLLEGSDVSRSHALLETHDQEAWLMDLGSANGTQINDRPLPPRHKVLLAEGQSFTIGTYQLEYYSPARA